MGRLPQTKPLSELLPRGAEGGKEFARIVNLLLLFESQERNAAVSVVDDSAGDYAGLDSVWDQGDTGRRKGFQYKFYPSPLTKDHRADIAKSLARAAANAHESKIAGWVLVTPTDFLEQPNKTTGGDFSWFDSLHREYAAAMEVEHWGHTKLQELFLKASPLCLFYYPELVPDGVPRKRNTLLTKKQYLDNLLVSHGRIHFVGMSVYKQEAAKGVALEDVYVPLRLVRDSKAAGDSSVTDPVLLLQPGRRSIVLGDPGSGKSTLLRFLALLGCNKALQKRIHTTADNERLPVLVTLRSYAEQLRTNPDLSLLDHVVASTKADYSLGGADASFFEFFLGTGKAILFFDGVDELPSPTLKDAVKKRILALLTTFPGNTCVVTSRIVGYDDIARLPDEFTHFGIASLAPGDIEQFVRDWYSLREQSPRERAVQTKQLLAVIAHPEHTAIRDLASNPLLLTIIALVHRIDAVLPDDRVVLYQKCTETLLNTWHTWKNRELAGESANRNRAERRNRVRLEALAYWMQQSGGDGKTDRRAIISEAEARQFLADHIRHNEKGWGPDADPEDLADAFLEFVRKKAGLLIEVGAQRYSFLHLTFQEYLASSHILATSEAGGVEQLWKMVAPRIGDPRWEETLRLLIASLRSSAAQKQVVERLLAHEASAPSTSAVPLLLGCLMDSADEAEELAPAILAKTLISVAGASDPEDIAQIVRRAAALAGRNDIQRAELSSAVAIVSENTPVPGRQGVQLAAVLAGAELPPASCSFDCLEGFILAVLQGADPNSPCASRIASLRAPLQRLGPTVAALAILNMETNFLATALLVYSLAASPRAGLRRLLDVCFVTCLWSDDTARPFKDFVANSFGLYPSLWRLQFEARQASRRAPRLSPSSSFRGRVRSLLKRERPMQPTVAPYDFASRLLHIAPRSQLLWESCGFMPGHVAHWDARRFWLASGDLGLGAVLTDLAALSPRPHWVGLDRHWFPRFAAEISKIGFALDATESERLALEIMLDAWSRTARGFGVVSVGDIRESKASADPLVAAAYICWCCVVEARDDDLAWVPHQRDALQIFAELGSVVQERDRLLVLSRDPTTGSRRTTKASVGAGGAGATWAR